MCLRDVSGNLHDIDMLSYIFFHEYSHIASMSIGH